jgi:CheY-like chemotaxis protein
MSSERGRSSDAYRVVVADDEATMRELMRTVLSLEPDFEVVGQAGDGAEAVALVTELRPDLVVIGVSMPVMDGLQAIERIRQVAPATPGGGVVRRAVPALDGRRYPHRKRDADRPRGRDVAVTLSGRGANASGLSPCADPRLTPAHPVAPRRTPRERVGRQLGWSTWLT